MIYSVDLPALSWKNESPLKVAYCATLELRSPKRVLNQTQPSAHSDVSWSKRVCLLQDPVPRELKCDLTGDPFFYFSVRTVRLFPFRLATNIPKQSWHVAFSQPRNACPERYQIPPGRIKAASLANTLSPAPQH